MGLATPGATGLGLGVRAGFKAADKVKDLAKTCCFVAGTQVSTKDGLKSIEQIKVGDLVLSKDEITGQMAFKPVTELIQRHKRVIYEIKTIVTLPNGESRTTVFKTTDDHPWRTHDGRWLKTIELANGTLIQSAYGNGVEVVSVINTGKITKTYNLEVADFHTYFVGEDRVWVHNACRPNDFSKKTKAEVRAEQPNCQKCGRETVSGKADTKGTKPAGNRSEIHHKEKASDGGSKTKENAENLCRDCHVNEHKKK